MKGGSADESSTLKKTSDQEIYEVVMEAIEACENMEINGSDRCIDYLNIKSFIPRLSYFVLYTHHDVLKAASTIPKYVEDLNDPIARKTILGSFNQGGTGIEMPDRYLVS
ncbi:hypothetical protein BYT27DRAFT_7278118 [Phlegmacium glaucopus]|nr:hypothetical protein BYT27DRAFT_7278118 [Phlegmacium glaucopus]